eukprot:scaffold350031_cov44-Prasinocladus_malaysianus.AAC.1
MAAGVLELVSKWTGKESYIHQEHCGLDAEPGAELSLDTCAALLGRANSLDVSYHHFIQSCQRFSSDDMKCYDLVVAMDTHVESRLLSANSLESGKYNVFRRKVVLFSDFFGWCNNAAVEHTGHGSLLPERLVQQIRPALDQTRMAVDVMRPDLVTPQGMDEWQDMTASLLLGCASKCPLACDLHSKQARYGRGSKSDRQCAARRHYPVPF